MQESCPACGGSTSVGRTPLRRAVEKSRRRAIGASSTTSLGELQRGGRRCVAATHQRTQSAASSGGVAFRASEGNDRVAEAGRKVTSVYLDGVEKYVSGLTQLTDEVTKASLSAARELIAS